MLLTLSLSSDFRLTHSQFYNFLPRAFSLALGEAQAGEKALGTRLTIL